MAQESGPFKITEEDYNNLLQDDRRKIAELIKEWRKTDKLTPDAELRERAYYKVTADSIEFD